LSQEKDVAMERVCKFLEGKTIYMDIAGHGIV
jgi:hypothetical protein